MVGPREERFDRSSRAAWAVPAALAAVVTAYLAWGAWISARHQHVGASSLWFEELAKKAAEGAETAGGGHGQAADPAVLAVAEAAQRMIIPHQINASRSWTGERRTCDVSISLRPRRSSPRH